MATKKKTPNASLATKSLGKIGDIKTDRPVSSYGSMMGEAARNGRAPVKTFTPAPVAPGYTGSLGAPLNPYTTSGIQAAADSAPGYTPVEGNRSKYAPSKTPAQRAADMMNAKYGSQIASLNSKGKSLDTDLSVGQATQTNYGAIGDKKLESIYADLTGQTQKIADNIKGVYAGADTAITQGYTDSAAALGGVAGQANKMLADQGAQLGISQGIPGASDSLNTYVGQAQAQGAVDKANSGANIKTLGANMSAAALKDVANTAQYGADNRRDLVMNVQNTISKLQFEHDKNKKELLDQLSALESEKASAMASATSDEEAKDYDRQFQEEQARIQTDFQNKTMDNQVHQQNLKNTMDKLDQEDRHTAQLNDTRLANQASDIQKLQMQEQIRNGTFNRAMAEKQYGLDVVNQALSQSKFTEDKRQNQFSEWLSKQGLDQKWALLSQDQRQQTIDNFNKNVQLQQGDRALNLQETNQFIDNARAQEIAKQAAATEAWKENPQNPEYQLKQQQLNTSKAQESNYKAQAQKASATTSKYNDKIDEFYKANKQLNNPEFRGQVDAIISWATRNETETDGRVKAKGSAYAILYNSGGGINMASSATDDEVQALAKLSKADKDKIFQAIKMRLG